ncbi:acetolactate synthase, small subunit [Marinobacter sp. LV10R510-11A]|uniref:ACT domain-containing protein n=1 Tax=Marinobacter sp. LV10R510-11A TaxID=1415568 RepID=UPI000BBF54FB|nr:ACT domain-containing protein [Marinobacter sp. LV10R510-11A]SOB76271.1 acetolactate synthase, small subunit [Marinobacter sp. LV10R510-11A]
MTTQSSKQAPSYTITCRMKHEAAALERLCQVVRIRGFRIATMAVESVLDGEWGGAEETLEIALTIQGARPVAMLQSQLEKLHTVADVKLAAPAVTHAANRIA